jgi:putative spermidine/putrescine transport system ATP-binding protein
MSVRANIGYGLKMKKLPKADIEARVSEVLEMCQLNDYAQRAVTALSGGQRQRVALARAIAPRPRLLLLDEPLSSLDAALRETLRDELAILLRKFNITAIFVTHDQNEAMAIADRVAVMSQGEIVQSGTPEELYRKPNSTFVASFVGSAMHLAGKINGSKLQLKGGEVSLPADGTGCEAFVRAENIQINKNGSLSGYVDTVTFLGTHYRVGISGVIAEPITSIFSGNKVPKLGEKINLTIEPQSILLLPSKA